MTRTNTTEKKITMPNADRRCWTLAGMLAIRAGTSLPWSYANSPNVSVFIRPPEHFYWAVKSIMWTSFPLYNNRYAFRAQSCAQVRNYGICEMGQLGCKSLGTHN